MPPHHLLRKLSPVLLATTLSYGCREAEEPPPIDLPETGASAEPVIPNVPPKPATAHLEPTKGNQVRGTVTFEPSNGAIRVTANIESLPPGAHGFHIHENGDCSAPDASSAGEHFSPIDMPHGGRDSGQRHVGDLGNVTADASGRAQTEFEDSLVRLEGGTSIVGRSVVVHAQPDDLTSQPSGGSGARLACGVIGRE